MNTGIFDQDRRTLNHPGFEWPKYSGSNAIFSAGITIAALINNELRMSSASYAGEYAPGYVAIVNGYPTFQSDYRFHIYSVRRGDNANTNPDWFNWGLMVPYGAPFVDVNHNGIYEPIIDTPGVKNAAQTIFVYMTDADPSAHRVNEGFGGGTPPMFNEVRLTAWCYNVSFLQDVQFLKYQIVNKNIYPWHGTYFSIFSDSDVGCGLDDYIGCDTVRNLGFCYNGHDTDCIGAFRYPGIVPSVGFLWLHCLGTQGLSLSSFSTFSSIPTSPPCERYGSAYNFMRGYKNDGTNWVIPPGGHQNITKFLYSGDPETGAGWNEGLPGAIHGSVQNCGVGIDTGVIIPVNIPGDRRLLMNSGSDNFTVNPGDTQKILIAQLIARGTNRLNSVTKLKQLSDSVRAFACGGFVIGEHNISSSVPQNFSLYQNFPNPFNPKTVIKFEVSKTDFFIMTVYDAAGKAVATLVNGNMQPGTYGVEWDGSNYPSGVYFYKIKSGSFEQTKKMVLLK